MPTPALSRPGTVSQHVAGLPRATLLALCACVLVAQSMVAAVNLLLPQLAASGLRPSPSELLWAVDAYVVVFAGLLIPAGAFGDRLGRRAALLTGLAVFAAGAALSGFAADPVEMIAGRALCGAGAALITPATMSLIVHLATPGHRPHALAAWTLAMGLGGFLGNLCGGLVGQFLSWRALFWGMVPLAALLALAVLRTTSPTPRRPETPLDPVGSLLLTGSLVAVVFGLIEGPEHHWAAGAELPAFGSGAVLLALYTWHALRAEHPLFDPRLLTARRLRAGALGMALSFFGLFALFYVNGQYLQYAKRFPVGLTGVALVPLTVGMSLMPRLASRLTVRRGPRLPATVGLVMIGVALLLLSTVRATTPYPLYAGCLLVLSAGAGLCAPPLTITVMSQVPSHQAGLGSGLNTAAREVGAALGVAAVGTVLAGRTHGVPHTAAQVADFTGAMGEGLRTVACVVLAVTVAVAVGLRGSAPERTVGPADPSAASGDLARRRTPA
ncbi:MFS transporter [Streptomyces sp. NPDC059740]|uniref:MFS transporter n=1 Tax=Streptomyces sp. NPDC059740 TaxID=3346926 RepID=UPI003648B54C